MKKKMLGLLALFSLWVMTLSLSGCGDQLIRPDDKQVLAMLQFEMPDLEPSPSNVLKKIERWMKTDGSQSENTLTFKSVQDNTLQAKGLVTIHTQGKDLKVVFKAQIEVINPNLIKFNATQFKDLPGPLEGESDRAPVFYNQVKEQVLMLCDKLENYLGDDNQSPIAVIHVKDQI